MFPHKDMGRLCHVLGELLFFHQRHVIKPKRPLWSSDLWDLFKDEAEVEVSAVAPVSALAETSLEHRLAGLGLFFLAGTNPGAFDEEMRHDIHY